MAETTSGSLSESLRPWTAEFVEPTNASTVPKYNLKPQVFTVDAADTMRSTAMPQRSAVTKSRKEQWAMSTSQVQTLSTEQPEAGASRPQLIQVCRPPALPLPPFDPPLRT